MAEFGAPRKFASLQELRQYAQSSDRDLLLLQDRVIDITSFAPHHPGGAVLLRNHKGEDVSEEMKFHHPLTLELANSMTVGSFRKDIQRIIRPDQPLVKQMWEITHENYMKVVYSPHWLFVPSPRMFQSDFLENFTHCRWYYALLMPILVVSYMLSRVDKWQFRGEHLLYCLSGVLFFTFVEYALHRFIFHSERHLPEKRLARFIHFFAHGIHHMLPDDPDRLVLPPPVYTVIFTLGYFTVGQLITFQDQVGGVLFWCFFQMGYVVYDVCHYALHHIDASSTKGYFHRLQQYHNQHHFGGEEAGFGVSSPLWDVILRTGFTRNRKDRAK